MNLLRKTAIASALIGITGSTRIVSAEPGGVPLELQVSIMVKTLSYETRLTKSKPELHIGVVAFMDANQSIAEAVRIVRLLEIVRQGKPRINDTPFTVESLRVTSPTALDDLVKKRGIHVLVLTASADRVATQIGALGKRHQCLIFTTTPAYLREGATVAILLKEGKPRIAMNRKLSREQGGYFLAEFLNLVDDFNH